MPKLFRFGAQGHSRFRGESFSKSGLLPVSQRDLEQVILSHHLIFEKISTCNAGFQPTTSLFPTCFIKSSSSVRTAAKIV